MKKDRSSFYYPVSYFKLAITLTIISLAGSFLLFSFFNDPALSVAGSAQQARKLSGVALQKIQNQVPKTPVTVDVSAPVTKKNPKTKSLTETFTEQLAQEIAATNQNGPQTIDGEPSILIPDNIDIQKLVQQNSKQIDWRNFIPKISDAEIKITALNSAEEYKRYLNSLYQIVRETLSEKNSTLETKLAQKDYNAIAIKMVEKYENTVGAVYALSVPVGLKDFHKKELALLTAQKNIYQKMASGKKDPLSALIATQANKKIDAEFLALKKELKTTIEKTL